MTLVQELRAQLERVVRDPDETIMPSRSSCDADVALSDVANRLDHTAGWSNYWFTQVRRIAILTAAIRAAVVTREAQP